MANLPQGNDMTGVLRHNANKGCRTCKTTKESLSASQLRYRNNITLSSYYRRRNLKNFCDYNVVKRSTLYGIWFTIII
ncbi:uncharacterized protein OCT59_005315 [Rhizophagus irregularis]|uniref:uncharacterized protein n=1 Tax=Rhizophagus irregularis TaxID=588596 RepID=UPI003316EB3F|nr:hypothetical protein OCT59_005315 [Rhizophagus irregularis]